MKSLPSALVLCTGLVCSAAVQIHSAGENPWATMVFLVVTFLFYAMVTGREMSIAQKSLLTTPKNDDQNH